MTFLRLQDHPIGPLCQPPTPYPHRFAWATRPREPVLAVTGLALEARLAAGPGVTTIMAGGNPAKLRSLLRTRVRPDCRAVISVGIAGGLDPSLVPGDVIVATGIAAPDRRHAASPVVAQRLAARLSSHPKRVILADLAGVESAVMSPGEKRTLRMTTGALAVDMESHVAAAFAARHGLPFAAVGWCAIRRIAPTDLVSAAASDGELCLSSVIRSLWQRPCVAGSAGPGTRCGEGFRALRHAGNCWGTDSGCGHDRQPNRGASLIYETAPAAFSQATASAKVSASGRVS
jgi:hypothetical protein